METVDILLKDIQDRLTVMGQNSLTAEAVRKLITEELDKVLADPATPSKMRFGAGNPGVEQKLFGSKFARWGLSLADIEFLYDMQRAMRDYQPNNFPGPSEALENAFRAISEACYVPEAEIRRLDQQAIDNMFPRIPLSAFYGPDRAKAARGAWAETDAYQRAMSNIRAMDTAESGYGSQLIGATYVGELWEAARRESRIFNLLASYEMRSPTEYLPVEADIPEMLFVGQSTTSSAGNYTTSKTGSNRVQVDAKKMVIHQMWSGEMDEDSIIPFVPLLRRQSVLSLAHYSDSLVLNGDTTNSGTGNINLDDADPADTKHYMAFDGIRHAALVDNTNNAKNLGGKISWAAMVAAYSRMVDTTYLMDWGHPIDPQDVVAVADVETADKIGLLDEVVNWRINQGKVLLPGQVAEVLGHPVIGSIAAGKTEADGKISTTAGSNTLGQVTTFNRRGFVVGWRRRVKTEIERIAATDQTRIVYSLRLGLGRYSPTGAASGIEAADVIYNIDLT